MANKSWQQYQHGMAHQKQWRKQRSVAKAKIMAYENESRKSAKIIRKSGSEMA
jgi:hypothetical protein